MSKILLPNIKPNLFLLDKKVALVGSGGRLLKVEAGAEIDAFTSIFRFNHAPTVGWEKHVGSRTDVRVVSEKVARRRGDLLINSLRGQNILVIGGGRGNLHPSNNVFNIVKRGSLNQHIAPNINRPLDAGLTLVALCIKAGIVPRLYGFDSEPGAAATRDHYWEKRGKASGFHETEKQMAALRWLHKEGKIVLC